MVEFAVFVKQPSNFLIGMAVTNIGLTKAESRTPATVTTTNVAVPLNISPAYGLLVTSISGIPPATVAK
jgi:hypothetical protein